MSSTLHFQSDAIEPVENFQGSEVVITPSFVFFWQPPAVLGLAQA